MVGDLHEFERGCMWGNRAMKGMGLLEGGVGVGKEKRGLSRGAESRGR